MDRCASGNFQTTENLYPLDFTTPSKPELAPPERELSPPETEPVLDLSCKKHARDTNSSPSRSPSTKDKNLDGAKVADYTDASRKSPFEGVRSYMVTPPSENDSPKKTKYEPIYNQINSTTSDPSVPMYPVMPVPPSGSPGAAPLPIAQSVVSQNSTQSPSGLAHTVATPAQSPDPTKKVPRPFKAYPKDPLSLTMGSAELIFDQNSNEAYSEFRKRMLDSVKKTNEGTNVKMRRVTKSPNLPTSTMDDKDAAYWERRRKNNEAAKRSRDARRAKEDEIAIRAAFLEQENIKLKYELVALRNETAKLRCMVYSS